MPYNQDKARYNQNSSSGGSGGGGLIAKFIAMIGVGAVGLLRVGDDVFKGCARIGSQSDNLRYTDVIDFGHKGTSVYNSYQRSQNSSMPHAMIDSTFQQSIRRIEEKYGGYAGVIAHNRSFYKSFDTAIIRANQEIQVQHFSTTDRNKWRAQRIRLDIKIDSIGNILTSEWTMQNHKPIPKFIETAFRPQLAFLEERYKEFTSTGRKAPRLEFKYNMVILPNGTLRKLQN